MQSNEPLILIISAHVLSKNILACFWEIVVSERIGFLTSNKARKIFVYIYRILKDPISPTVLPTLEHCSELEKPGALLDFLKCYFKSSQSLLHFLAPKVNTTPMKHFNCVSPSYRRIYYRDLSCRH